MRIKHISYLTVTLALLLPVLLPARKAHSGPVLLCQPDGSSFTATIVGDEFSHVTMTAAGEAVVQDADGWWCYALFDADGHRHCSGKRVGANPDPAAAAASRRIPFDKLVSQAEARRFIPVEDRETECLVRRLNRQNFGTPEVSSGMLTKSGTVTKHGIIILCAFKDVPFRYTRQNFLDMIGRTGYSDSGATGCAKEYFESQFHGLYNFEFDISEIVTLSRERSYYGGNNEDGDDKNPEQMVKEACQLAKTAGIDFSLYDDDNDGRVDNVFIFYSGADEAEGGGDDCIWPHSWYLYSGARINLVIDGKRIDRYACASELAAKAWGAGGKPSSYGMTPIGTFCHEFSHTLGLPDFYDTDYEKSGGTAKGLWGSTSLMDSGNENNSSNTPPAYNSMEREILGIGMAENLPEGRVEISPLDAGGKFYRINSTTRGEYYLLEFRKAQGWDSHIGGSGLLVYHVDKSENDAGSSTTYSQKLGRNLKAIERWEDYNEINCRPDHQCADLIEAVTTARSVASVFFPNGSNNSFSPTGTHKIAFWDGTTANITISNISMSGDVMSMSVAGDSGIEIPPDAKIGEIVKFQDAAIIPFTSSFIYQGEATVKWGIAGKEYGDPVTVAPYDGRNFAYVIEGLKPGTTYRVNVVFSGEKGVEGTADTKSFMTSSIQEDSAPHIYLKCVQRNDDGSFPSGCALPLRLFNAPTAEGVEWTYDGVTAEPGADGFFHPTKSGLLKAVAVYPDGTRDVIVKKINIR